jgi:hypothetical protein
MPTEQETFPTIKQMQIQAKTIMLVMAHIMPLQHTMEGTTTLDMDITPTQHHITEEITTPGTDIMPETQDTTLAHILNQQEPHPQMLDPGHPQQTQPTYIIHPIQRRTHRFITPDTSHLLQQTTTLDSLALTL